jgi:hypothetical protein
MFGAGGSLVSVTGYFIATPGARDAPALLEPLPLPFPADGSLPDGEESPLTSQRRP